MADITHGALKAQEHKYRSALALPFVKQAIIGLILFGVLSIVTPGTVAQNLYGQQALAFLNGRTSLVSSPFLASQDIATFNGSTYCPFPPGPALLLVPYIWLFGASAPIAGASVPLALVSIYLMSILYKRGTVQARNWLLAGFLLGSGLLTVLISSSQVWYFAHVVAVFAVTLALYINFTFKLRTIRSGVAIGIAMALAFLSRQDTVFMAPLFIVLIWRGNFIIGTRLERLRPVIGFAIALGCGVLLYLAFNYMRFGNAFDTGYARIVLQSGSFLDVRIGEYGLFSPHYLMFNLTHFLFGGLGVAYTGTDLLTPAGLDTFGTGLLIASPFLIVAFYAKYPIGQAVAWWGTILFIAGTQMMYYNNGFSQINTQRFALDYMPLLMILVGLGSWKLPASLIKGLVVWSIALNMVAIIARVS